MCGGAACPAFAKKASTSTHKCGMPVPVVCFLLDARNLKRAHFTSGAIGAPCKAGCKTWLLAAACRGAHVHFEVTVSLGFSDQGHSHRRSKK